MVYTNDIYGQIRRLADAVENGGSGSGSGTSSTIWTDNTGAYFVRIDTDGVITWTDMLGVESAAPGAGARPADTSAAVVSALTTLQGFVDGLEGYTDGLETLAAATNTLLTTQAGYLDGVEGKLDTIAADIVSATSAIGPQVPASGASVTPTIGGTGTLSSVASGTSSAQALAANANRRSAIFVNTDANRCYLKYGTTAAASSFTLYLDTDDQIQIDDYTGRVDCIWAADGSGSLFITEVT